MQSKWFSLSTVLIVILGSSEFLTVTVGLKGTMNILLQSTAIECSVQYSVPYQLPVVYLDLMNCDGVDTPAAKFHLIDDPLFIIILFIVQHNALI